ncbi:MAG: FIST N-terminal domain-containing protein [Verrucomicrobium sp.]|nr:FIST N-terminal domain-containing protein [Verrucomicrobium sp.]
MRASSHLYAGPYDETAVRTAAHEALEKLGTNPTLGIVFATPDYLSFKSDFLELLRLHAHIPLLVGASGQGLIGIDKESEEKPGFSILLLSMPGVTAKASILSPARCDDAEANASSWHRATGVKPGQTKAWLTFIDPFSVHIERWMARWNEAYPGIPTVGGLASNSTAAEEAWVFLDGDTVEGGVAVSLDGPVEVKTLVSQGCKPIGEPYTITSVDQNVLYTLGSQPAYQILDGAFQALTESEKERARGHLFAGLAMSEYVEEFKRGDFLVRSILGADPNTGAVAIAAKPRVGQTLQYQLRDAEAASADLHYRLEELQTEMANGPVPFAALLCTCNGRGTGLFGDVDHDAHALDEHFPGMPVAGFFANGEIGPVGGRSYVHGYSVALAIFREAAE